MRYGSMLLGAALMLVATTAHAGVDFQIKSKVAAPDKAGPKVEMIASEPGKLDIVFASNDASARYTRWELAQRDTENEGRVIDAEPIVGLTHDYLGIGRSKDKLSVGLNNSKKLLMWTRGEDGKWTSSDSGVLSATYAGQTGGFDVDPSSGRGGITTITQEGQRVVALQQEDGTWKTRVLEEALETVTRGDFAYSRIGRPLVAYQRLGGGTATVAGDIDNFGVAFEQCHRWFPLSIATDAKKGVHLLVVVHTGMTLYRHSSDGQAWDAPVIISKSGDYGDAAFCDIAASPDGRQVAALFTVKNKLNIATSNDTGKTWELTELPGAGAQDAAICFDPRGVLYVAFYTAEDKTMHLWGGKIK